MKISVNGQTRELAAHNVARALGELDFNGASVATAVNGEFVLMTTRADRELAEGDRLEVLAPMQGG